MKRGPKKRFHSDLHVKVTAEVREALERAAAANGMRLSDFTRDLLRSWVAGEDIPCPPPPTSTEPSDDQPELFSVADD